MEATGLVPNSWLFQITNRYSVPICIFALTVEDVNAATSHAMRRYRLYWDCTLPVVLGLYTTGCTGIVLTTRTIAPNKNAISGKRESNLNVLRVKRDQSCRDPRRLQPRAAAARTTALHIVYAKQQKR
jgi:hypothetical protein